MNIKAIVVDLDRTLLRSDKTLSPYTASVFRECGARGLRVIVATARPLRDIEQYRRLVRFDALVVSNGARVIRGPLRMQHGIARPDAERLLSALARRPELTVTLETGDCAYSNRPVADYGTVIRSDLRSVAGAEGALKILAHIDRAETAEAIRSELPERLYCTLAHGYMLQIMSREATKWNGVRTVLELEGCRCSEAVYFGDDHDDVEPLRKCGIGVAVSNGIDEAKAAADFIAESNDADGVAKFIEAHWLSLSESNQEGAVSQ